jgi:hypothetical protein
MVVPEPERHVAAPRTIEQRVSDERDRFYGGMGGKRLDAIPPEGVDARVGPNVGAIATETAQFDIVSVGMAANPEDADEFRSAHGSRGISPITCGIG